MAVSTRPPLRPALSPAIEARAEGEARSVGRAGPALLLALVAAIAYAAFAHGATEPPDETWLQLGLAGLTLAGAATWLWEGGLRLRAPAYAWAGLGLLFAFAAWSALSLLWTVAPDNTWLELNRAFAYGLVLLLGIAAGASYPRALERLAAGYLIVAVLVALYAFGGKAIPGVHLGGVFDLDQTSLFPRLRAPLEYWNALALFCAMAVPIALRFAVAAGRRVWRLGSAGALFLLFTVLGLTYSRGGMLAAVVAVVASLWLGSTGRTLRSLWIALAALVASALPLTLALVQPALTLERVPLALRESAGLYVLYAFLGGLALVVALAFVVELAGNRVGWRPGWDRWARRGRRTGAALVAILVVAAVANGSVGSAIDSFTSEGGASVSDPSRVISANSGHRWTWWNEAMGAFSARPLEGWGAGSFPVTHLLYRHNRLPVQQPHSVPVQFLAETGIVGFLLAFGGCVLLVGGALWGARRLPRGRERALAAAAAAAGLAWLVHGLVDWDWDMPGVTVPALVFLGVAAGRSGLPLRSPNVPRWNATGRAVALGSLTAMLCLVALSAGLPAWAQSKADGAFDALGAKPTAADLQNAASELELAARLNPLSDEALIDGASIAQRRGRLVDQRNLLLRAVEREPYDSRAWSALAQLDLGRQDPQAFLAEARRALAVDPESYYAPALVAQAEAYRTPVNESASATGTPLPLTYQVSG